MGLRTSTWRTGLRLLAAVLSLHMGLAQAAMGHAATASGAHEATPAPAINAESSAAPCHGHGAAPQHAAMPSAPAANDYHHGKPCCDTDRCHCAATCGMPDAIARLTPAAITAARPVRLDFSPKAASAPELPPPIS